MNSSSKVSANDQERMTSIDAYSSQMLSGRINHFLEEFSKKIQAFRKKLHLQFEEHKDELEKGFRNRKMYVESTKEQRSRFAPENLTAGDVFCKEFLGESIESMTMQWEQITEKLDALNPPKGSRKQTSVDFAAESGENLYVREVENFVKDRLASADVNVPELIFRGNERIVQEFQSFLRIMKKFACSDVAANASVDRRVEHKILTAQRLQEMMVEEMASVGSEDSMAHADAAPDELDEEEARRFFDALKKRCRTQYNRVKYINEQTSKITLVDATSVASTMHSLTKEITEEGADHVRKIQKDNEKLDVFKHALESARHQEEERFNAEEDKLIKSIKSNKENQMEEWAIITAAATNIEELCAERETLIKDSIHNTDTHAYRSGFFLKAEEVIKTYTQTCDMLMVDIDAESKALESVIKYVDLNLDSMNTRVERYQNDADYIPTLNCKKSFADFLLEEEEEFQKYSKKRCYHLCQKIAASEHAIRQYESQKSTVGALLQDSSALRLNKKLIDFHKRQIDAISKARASELDVLSHLNNELAEMLELHIPIEIDINDSRCGEENDANESEPQQSILDDLEGWKQNHTRALVMEAERLQEEARVKQLGVLEEREGMWSKFRGESESEVQVNPIENSRKARDNFTVRLRQKVSDRRESSVQLSQAEYSEFHSNATMNHNEVSMPDPITENAA